MTGNDPKADELKTRVERFTKLAEQHPQSELPWFSLGQTWQAAGRFDTAAEAFAQAAQRRPDFMMAHLLRGEMLIALGRLQEARESVERALALAIAQGHEGPQQQCEELLEELA